MRVRDSMREPGRAGLVRAVSARRLSSCDALLQRAGLADLRTLCRPRTGCNRRVRCSTCDEGLAIEGGAAGCLVLRHPPIGSAQGAVLRLDRRTAWSSVRHPEMPVGTANPPVPAIAAAGGGESPPPGQRAQRSLPCRRSTASAHGIERDRLGCSGAHRRGRRRIAVVPGACPTRRTDRRRTLTCGSRNRRVQHHTCCTAASDVAQRCTFATGPRRYRWHRIRPAGGPLASLSRRPSRLSLPCLWSRAETTATHSVASATAGILKVRPALPGATAPHSVSCPAASGAAHAWLPVRQDSVSRCTQSRSGG